MSLSTGDIIDSKYRIIRLIGEGGMGAVYEGENVRIHRRVAIKVLHAAVAENQDAVQRFEREAQAAGRIGSEHIVEVLDLGNLADGDRYMVMEFLEGDSLSDRIRNRGRLTPAEIYPLAVQILEGLKAAHGAGIIHRDLKPDNAFLLKSRKGQADFVKLLDFGISKFSQLSGESGFSMTRTGSVMGTPYYMSPEQAKGAKGMDQRADLYAVGVILYECLTGQVPFNADTFNELLFKIVLEEPPPLPQLVPDLDPGFAAIVGKGMAREPAHRFQTAEEFQASLVEWAQTGATPQAIAAAQSRPPPGPNVKTPSAVTPLGTGTPGTWSSSGSYSGAQEPVAKKSSAGLVAAIVVVGLLVAGGGAAFALAGSGDDRTGQAAQDVLAEEQRKKAEEESRKSEEARKQAEADRQRLQGELARSEEERKKSEEERRKSEQERLKSEQHRLEQVKAAVAPAPRAAARPAPAKPRETKPAEKPASTSGSTGGRQIRTEL
jgi:serine/threonine protein kinase